MPNHVINVLTFEGSQLVIDELFKAIEGIENGQHIDIDFDKIIPMPESLNVEDGGMYDLAMKIFCADDYRRLHIKQVEGLSDKQMERYIKLGEAYARNKLQYGSCTWYDWRRKNWGTKWNAYEIERVDNTLIFETAWSTPIPIITKISEMFPTIKIDHKFADEDIGNNCGYYIWWNGGIISKVEFDYDGEVEFADNLWARRVTMMNEEE